MLSQSEKTDLLALALIKARKEMSSVKATGINVRFPDSRYPKIGDVVDEIIPHLLENGIIAIQGGSTNSFGPCVVTRLLHISGQWIETEYPWKVPDDPQKTASCFTYACRYALQAAVRTKSEDDDGNKASDKILSQTDSQDKTSSKNPALRRDLGSKASGEQSVQSRQNKTELQRTNLNSPTGSPRPSQADYPSRSGWHLEKVTDKQIKRMFAMLKEAQMTEDELKERMIATFGIESTKDLTKEQIQMIFQFLELRTENNKKTPPPVENFPFETATRDSDNME
jgi:ERF superfamily